MRHLLKSKKALSTVVTTLIILVISVLLATVVTYYAMNMVGTRVIEEDGRITQLHIWVDCATNSTCNATTAQAALVFKNTGGRDILIDKITVRYQEISWTNIYYNITCDSITDGLTYECEKYNGTAGKGYFIWGTNTTLKIEGGGAQPHSRLKRASSEICLETGESIIIYIAADRSGPDAVDCLDVGTPIPIGVHTSNAIYYKETNVEAVW